MTTRNLGTVPVEIRGDDSTSVYLREEFAALPTAHSAAAVSVSRVSVDQIATTGARFGRLVIGDDGSVLIDYGTWLAKLDFTSTAESVVHFAVRTTASEHRLGKFVERGRDWNYLSSAESIAKNVIYDGLDQAIQIQNLNRQQTFIHASSLELDGVGVAVGGWGGVGKTSSVMQLVRERGYRFLSDDLGLIDASGMLFRSPKRLQIYPYNLVGIPGLHRHLFKGRGRVDHLQWHVLERLRGKKAVRRRVTAEEFFGPERVGTSAPLAVYVQLERGHWESPSVREIDALQVARRTSHTLMYELSPLPELSFALSSHLQRNDLELEALRMRVEAIVARGLESSACYEVRVPIQMPPSELSVTIGRLLESHTGQRAS